MTVYNVFIPPDDDPEKRATGFRLVPDSKSVLALIFPPIWLAWHRLWLALLVWFVIAVVIVLIGFWQPGPLVGYLWALPGFYLLLEGNQLICNRLERLGWRHGGVVEAENPEEGELRFVMNSPHLFKETSLQTNPSTSLPDFKPPVATGLFPE